MSCPIYFSHYSIWVKLIDVNVTAAHRSGAASIKHQLQLYESDNLSLRSNCSDLDSYEVLFLVELFVS